MCTRVCALAHINRLQNYKKKLTYTIVYAIFLQFFSIFCLFYGICQAIMATASACKGVFCRYRQVFEQKSVIFMYFLPKSLCIVIQAEGKVNAVMQVRHNVLTVEVIGFPWMDVHELLFDLQRNAFGRFASFLAV